MYCTKCGKELADGTKFCTGCGTSSDPATAKTQNDEKLRETTKISRLKNNKYLKPRNIIIACIALVLIISGCVWGKWCSERNYRAHTIVEDHNYGGYYTGEVNQYSGKLLRQITFVDNFWVVRDWTCVNKNIPVLDEIKERFDVEDYKDIVAVQYKITKSETDEFIAYFVFGCNSSKKKIPPVPIGILYEEDGKYKSCLEGRPKDVITVLYDWRSYLNELYGADYQDSTKEDWYERNLLPSSEYAADNVLKMMIKKAEGGEVDPLLSSINSDGTFEVGVPIGESVELATINIKVLGCDEYSSLQTKYSRSSDPAPSGSKFVVFEVEVENITGSSLEDWSLKLTLIDSENREFEKYDMDYRYTDNTLDYIQLSPNIPTVGYLIYNVPSDCTGYYLAISKAGTNKYYRLLGN